MANAPDIVVDFDCSDTNACFDGRSFSSANLSNFMKTEINRWVKRLNNVGARAIFFLIFFGVVPIFRVVLGVRSLADVTFKETAVSNWEKRGDNDSVQRKGFFDSMG